MLFDRSTCLTLLATILVTGGGRYAIEKRPQPDEPTVATKAPIYLTRTQTLKAKPTPDFKAELAKILEEAPDEGWKTRELWVRWLEITPEEAMAAARACEHYYFAQTCLATWNEMNPQAVSRYLSNNHEDAVSRGMIETYVKHFPKEAAEGFLAKLTGAYIPPEILQAIAEHGPGRLGELASTAENAGMRWMEPFAKTWTASDPEAALAWAQDIDDYGQRAEVLAVVYENLFAGDRDSLAEAYDSLPMGLAREKLTPALAKLWLTEGSKTALQWAQGLSRSIDRRQALKTIWTESVRQNPNQGFAFIAAHHDETGFINNEVDRELEQLGQTAAPENPLKQLTWLAQANIGTDGASQLDELLLQKPHKDLALQIEALPKSESQRRILGTFIKRWSVLDRETTQAYVEELVLSEDRLVAAEALIEQTVQDEPLEVIAWLNTLPEADKISLGRLTADQPELAYSVLDEITNDSVRENTIIQLINRWEDAATTVTLLDQLPPDRQETYYRTLAFKYTRQDPDAASEWLSSLPDGGAKDRGIEQMLRVLTQTWPGKPDVRDYPLAFQWAQTIQDEALRKNQISTAAWMWHRRSPIHATAAIENADLPLSFKENLLDRFRNLK